MQYVQLVLTDYQAGMVGSALSSIESDNESATEQIGQLADFFLAVGNNPSAFPVRSKEMSRSLKKRVARMKGPAQPERPNARRRKQARKIGFQRRTRQIRRMQVALFNESRTAALEALALEKAQADREASSILPGA